MKKFKILFILVFFSVFFLFNINVLNSQSKKKIRKFGRLASEYAKQYFKGQKYILVYYKGKGHYRRTLAVVKRLDKETTYNYDVVKDGYACIYRWAFYPDKIKKAYNKAKKEKKGLWGLNFDLMRCLCEK